MQEAISRSRPWFWRTVDLLWWHARERAWLLTAAIGLVAFAMHYELLVHSGAFWRDEASTIQVAQKATLSEMWGALDSDSFLILPAAVLRLWIRSGLGKAELGIRLLGIVISLGALGMAWRSLRELGVRTPVLALGLLAFNANYVYFATSIRGYGLATLASLGCFAALWNLVSRPSRSTTAIALVAALTAAHTNYQVSYLLFAMGTAGAVLSFRAGRRRTAAVVLLVCLAAALSLTIYLPTIENTVGVNRIRLTPVRPELVGATLLEFLAAGSRWQLALWGLVLAAAASAVFSAARDPASREVSPSSYATLVLLIALPAHVLFCRVIGLDLYPWHHLPFVAMTAVALEVILAKRFWTRAVLAVLAVGAGADETWTHSHYRRTNIDLVAHTVAAQAQENDLVLLADFWYKPSFSYYYKGKAPWTTTPGLSAQELSDGTFFLHHVKEYMTKENPLGGLRRSIRDVMAKGGRLWIVGEMSFQEFPTVPVRLDPAPDREFGWSSAEYLDRWLVELAYFLQENAERVEYSEPIGGLDTHALERLPFYRVVGWKTR